MTKRELAKIAAFGSLVEWREACLQAKREGFTENQVQGVLVLSHPVTWIAVVSLVWCVILSIFA